MMLPSRHSLSQGMAGRRELLEPVMCPRLEEAAQAQPLFGGESHFVADHPRCTCDGLVPENMMSLLANTGLVDNTQETVAIMAEACRLVKGPSDASCWTASWRDFGLRRLGSS